MNLTPQGAAAHRRMLAAAREYWTLKNKKPASAKQAKWIRMRLAELRYRHSTGDRRDF